MAPTHRRTRSLRPPGGAWPGGEAAPPGAAPGAGCHDGEVERLLEQAQLLDLLPVEPGACSPVTRVPTKLPPPFAAAPAEHADLLVVVTPGAPRFEGLRQLERIANGTMPHALAGTRRRSSGQRAGPPGPRRGWGSTLRRPSMTTPPSLGAAHGPSDRQPATQVPSRQARRAATTGLPPRGRGGRSPARSGPVPGQEPAEGGAAGPIDLPGTPAGAPRHRSGGHRLPRHPHPAAGRLRQAGNPPRTLRRRRAHRDDLAGGDRRGPD